MNVKKLGGIEYLTCSSCGGEIDGNGECRSYCLIDCDKEHKEDGLAEDDWRQDR